VSFSFSSGFCFDSRSWPRSTFPLRLGVLSFVTLFYGNSEAKFEDKDSNERIWIADAHRGVAVPQPPGWQRIGD
jgi:hypothetical protein